MMEQQPKMKQNVHRQLAEIASLEAELEACGGGSALSARSLPGFSTWIGDHPHRRRMLEIAADLHWLETTTFANRE